MCRSTFIDVDLKVRQIPVHHVCRKYLFVIPVLPRSIYYCINNAFRSFCHLGLIQNFQLVTSYNATSKATIEACRLNQSHQLTTNRGRATFF